MRVRSAAVFSCKVLGSVCLAMCLGGLSTSRQESVAKRTISAVLSVLLICMDTRVPLPRRRLRRKGVDLNVAHKASSEPRDFLRKIKASTYA